MSVIGQLPLLVIQLLNEFAGFSLLFFVLSLFACPKGNQKRQPKTKQPVFGEVFSIKLLNYCGEVQWSFDVLILASTSSPIR
jgi:hypothetical protein